MKNITPIVNPINNSERTICLESQKVSNKISHFALKVSKVLFVLACFFMPTITAMAQCPMCKLSAGDSDVREGLNDGILYLLAAPFLLMGGALLWWYLNRKKYENYTNK